MLLAGSFVAMEDHESGTSKASDPEVVAEGPKLSHRAEIFRSKLIEEFQILEGTSEQGRKKVPVYSTTEMIGILTVLV